jgi:hypothetical protein
MLSAQPNECSICVLERIGGKFCDLANMVDGNGKVWVDNA